MAQLRCSNCGGLFNGGNCPSCSIVGYENEFVHDPNPLPYDNTPDFSYQPPQHHYSINHQPSIIQDLNLKLISDELMIEQRNELFKAMQSMFEEYRQREQVANLSTHTPKPSRRFNSICYDDDDYKESTIPLSDIISQISPSIVIPRSLIMGNEELSTILEKESDEFIKSSVEDLFQSQVSPGIHPGVIDLLVTPLFDANKDDCFNPGGDDDEINVLDCEDSYYDSEGDILYLKSLLNDDLVHRDPSIPAMSVASILEGFTVKPPLKENDDLFDLKYKNDD
nr:hypothetical protein [Tanacetum cinerariifolium]